MKLQTTADGLKAVKVNTEEQFTGNWYNGVPEERTEYLLFHEDNDPLPLTQQMPGNTVFEGVEVWQTNIMDVKWVDINKSEVDYYQGHGYATRKAYQPLEVKEQVREEAPKDPFAFGFALLNKIGNPVKQEAPNLELGVEEAASKHFLSEAEKSFNPDFIKANGGVENVVDNGKHAWYIKGATFGANWQATQQQGLVSVESVIDVVQS